MPNKLLITSAKGGFDAQLEIDGRLSTKDFFDCDSNPVITTATGSCPTSGLPFVQVCNDKGEKSVPVAEDCILLDGVAVLPADIYTILDGICPATNSTADLATEATLLEVRDALQAVRIKDFEYTGNCVYDSSGEPISPSVKQYKVLICDYEANLVSETYILNQHNLDGSVTVYTLQAGDQILQCGDVGIVNPLNISDKLKVDGLTGTLDACSSFDFAWATTGSGQLEITNTVTGRVTVYPYSDGLAPFNAVDEDREILETYTFNATNATGLYLNTQGCRIVTN